MRAFIAYFMLLLAMAANVALASPIPHDSTVVQVEIIEHKESVFAVHYQMPQEGQVHIKVVDAKTRAFIFAETIAQQQVGIVKYDLSHLPRGLYVIEVRGGGEFVTRFVQLQ